MKVALAVEWCDPRTGGQAIWARGLARHLASSGHDVHVIAQDAQVACDNGWPATPHKVDEHWQPLRRARAYRPVLAALNPDVIHNSGVTVCPGVFQPQTGSALAAYDAMIRSETPVRRVKLALLPRHHFLRASMALLEQRQAEAADRIVAISSMIEGLLRKRHVRQERKITCVPNGVDEDALRLGDFAAGRLATRRLHLGERQSQIMLFVAHNLKLKGFDTALKVLEQLIRAGDDVHLIVAGAERPSGKGDLAPALHLVERVSFVGQQMDMRPLYAASDLLLHPSRWDACGLVVLEALAMGLPVVTTATTGAAAFVRDGPMGAVARSAGDVETIVSSCRRVLAERPGSMPGRHPPDASLPRLSENYATVERILVEASTGRGARSPRLA